MICSGYLRGDTHAKLQAFFCDLILMVRLDIFHHRAEIKLPLL